MGRAKQMKLRRKRARRVPFWMPDQWVVFGVDRYGEEYNHPHETKEAAEITAERVKRRGGNVDVRREVWNGPAAAYRVFREVVSYQE